ncbi:UdgX family uracil-DNA binding protein [Burkholderia gladioli]|uniref:UdgX family uracil-DNA binding protein n=1 Tax=Burkholderia gladioli TaxID=28095 RepID=UPI003F7A9603
MEMNAVIAEPPGADVLAGRDAPPTLDACRRCPLWARATQPVGGRGPVTAAIMLVGEQPGDHDDRRGTPFSGTAGGILERALREASLARATVYLTHVVKHFKWEARGKRRLPVEPAPEEVAACRYWLDHEIDAVAPRVIVALGALAWRAVLDDPLARLPVAPLPVRLPSGLQLLATQHPDFVLRTRDADSRERVYQQIAAALRVAKRLAYVADLKA